jgi:methionine-rich copper-binding protein CopC
MSRRLIGVAVGAVALAVVVLVLTTRPPALRVVASEPADGAVLGAPPREVAVSLTGVRDPSVVHLTVAREDGGAAVTTAPADLRGDRLVAPVSIVDRGGYLVAYHVELADGRQVSGLARFALAAPGQAVDRGRPGAPDSTGAAGGHQHTTRDPLGGVLLAVDLVLTGVLVAYLLRRPRLRRSRDATVATSNPPSRGPDRMEDR